MINGLFISPQKIISKTGGNIYHIMKDSDIGFFGYGEAYFSTIEPGFINAWKRHTKMTLNLVVPVGKIRFVIFDDRNSENKQFQQIILSKENYCRLTVPPMVWMGFQGLSNGRSMLLNIANIEHDPSEVDRLEIEKINYDWSIN